jgi:hypothetical protein
MAPASSKEEDLRIDMYLPVEQQHKEPRREEN